MDLWKADILILLLMGGTEINEDKPIVNSILDAIDEFLLIYTSRSLWSTGEESCCLCSLFCSTGKVEICRLG